MPPERLSATFSALADPTRRAILARLASGEASVTELAGPFAMSLPAVSKHLKVLEHAGLVSRGRAGWTGRRSGKPPRGSKPTAAPGAKPPAARTSARGERRPRGTGRPREARRRGKP